jgi:hypothetical protein
MTDALRLREDAVHEARTNAIMEANVAAWLADPKRCPPKGIQPTMATRRQLGSILTMLDQK